MKSPIKTALAMATFGLAALVPAIGDAAPILLVNQNLDWKQVGHGATWVLPACTTLGCENEPSGETTGLWYGNTAWAGLPSIIKILDADGVTLSDVITFDSSSPTGDFRVQFFSDPNPGVLADYSNYVTYATYTEGDPNAQQGAVSGPQQICCELLGSFVNVASDGEVVFDPFGFGADTSDGIQFTGNVVGSNVPLPSPLLLMLTGLAGLGFLANGRKQRGSALAAA